MARTLRSAVFMALAALAGVLLWLLAEGMTGLRLGAMAVVLGALVGLVGEWALRGGGARRGVSAWVPVLLAGLLALAGSAAGKLLTTAARFGRESGYGLLEVLEGLDEALLGQLLEGDLTAGDFVFWGLAAFLAAWGVRGGWRWLLGREPR